MLYLQAPPRDAGILLKYHFYRHNMAWYQVEMTHRFNPTLGEKSAPVELSLSEIAEVTAATNTIAAKSAPLLTVIVHANLSVSGKLYPIAPHLDGSSHTVDTTGRETGISTAPTGSQDFGSDPWDLLKLAKLCPVGVGIGSAWRDSSDTSTVSSRVVSMTSGMATIVTDARLQVGVQNNSQSGGRLPPIVNLHFNWQFDITDGSVRSMAGDGTIVFPSNAITPRPPTTDRITFILTRRQGFNDRGRSSAALIRSPNLPGTTVRSSSFTARSQQDGKKNPR